MTQGLHAQIYDDGDPTGPVLAIGSLIPRIHSSDGMPVYLVAEHPQGVPITFRNGSTHKLLAYPSAWAGPAHRADSKVLFVAHERLPFEAPVPIYDEDGDQ